jgi:hypothetical protein
MQDKNRKLQFIFHSPYQNILNIYIDRRKSYTPYTEVSKIVITFVSPTTYNFPQKTPHPTLILHDPTLNVMRRSFAIPSPRRLPSRTAPIPPSFSTTKNTPFSTPIFDAKTTIQKAPRKHTILTGPSRLGIPRLRNTERQRRTQDLGPVIPPPCNDFLNSNLKEDACAHLSAPCAAAWRASRRPRLSASPSPFSSQPTHMGSRATLTDQRPVQAIRKTVTRWSPRMFQRREASQRPTRRPRPFHAGVVSCPS